MFYWISLASPDLYGRVADRILPLIGYLMEATIKTVIMDVIEDAEIDEKLLGDGDSGQLLFE